MARSGGKKKPRLVRKAREVSISLVVRTDVPLELLRDPAWMEEAFATQVERDFGPEIIRAGRDEPVAVAAIDERPKVNVLQHRGRR